MWWYSQVQSLVFSAVNEIKKACHQIMSAWYLKHGNINKYGCGQLNKCCCGEWGGFINLFIPEAIF